MVSHHFDVPHSNLPQDPIFYFVVFSLRIESSHMDLAFKRLHRDDSSAHHFVRKASRPIDRHQPSTARLTLRQEDAISQLQLDKSFMFFIQCGRGSIMPILLLTQAKEWNQLKEKGEAKMPLRMHIFLQCFQLLAQRAQQLKFDASDDTLVQNLRSKGILTEDSKWAYLS